PQTSEAAVKITTPTRKTRRRPSRSAARPPSRRKPPNAIAYAVMTHCRFSCENFRSFAIDGSATLTIETSRIVMKNAVATTARIRQRCGSGGIRQPYRGHVQGLALDMSQLGVSSAQIFPSLRHLV